jgi:hypothetical protein
MEGLFKSPGNREWLLRQSRFYGHSFDIAAHCIFILQRHH